MSVAQNQQLYKIRCKAIFVKEKTQDSAKKFEAREAIMEAKTDNSSDEILFAIEMTKCSN